jgi:serine phosphatase RsbU (regulator of sigma subunit)/anti-sigma regulatory factor (Ser/Thr protein kinase)
MNQPTHRVALRLYLECELVAVRPATLAVRAFLAQQGVGEQEAGSCELALAEACNNAVAYVVPEKRHLPVCVEALVDAGSIEIRVEDHTPGFELPETSGVPDPQEESGRGLFLMRSLMEEVVYWRGPEGNCLVMRRRRESGTVSGGARPVSVESLRRRLAKEEQLIRDMAEELSSCYESLSAIFRFGAEQASAVNIREFARRLLEDLLRITGASWYVLRIVAEDARELTVYSSSEPARWHEPILLPQGAEDGASAQSLEAKAVQTRRDAWFDRGSPLGGGDPLAGLSEGSVGLVHPFYFGETLIGTLAVGGRGSGFGLTAARTNVIHTFTDFLAIQMVNSRYQEQRVNSLLVARDLEIARHIQRSLLVKMLPEIPGVGLAGYCESASEVGGDFFDVIRVSETGLLILISDVMGKGIPAAMFAVILRSLVRASLSLATRPAELLAQVNGLLFEELSNVEMFITAQLVYVDMAERRLVVGNAGHCPMVIAVPGMGEPLCVAPEGIPLGVLAHPEFDEEVVPLQDDLRAVLYTDGLTEVRGPNGEQFGQPRLVEWVERSAAAGESASEMKAELLEELRKFRGDHALPDDQTFMIIALSSS